MHLRAHILHVRALPAVYCAFQQQRINERALYLFCNVHTHSRGGSLTPALPFLEPCPGGARTHHDALSCLDACNRFARYTRLSCDARCSSGSMRAATVFAHGC